MAEKKVDPKALKQNNLLGIIGAVMVIGAVAWIFYNGFLRPPTEQELKEQREQEISDRFQKAEEARGKGH